MQLLQSPTILLVGHPVRGLALLPLRRSEEREREGALAVLVRPFVPALELKLSGKLD